MRRISALARLRAPITLLLLLALLAPVPALASGNGKKKFKEGMRHEVAEEWDKAAEAFALAVADSPKNPEYRLHLVRALFNASQMYMKRGRLLAEQKDYEGAYIAFRKAYGFDPVNELARSEMARMVRLQEEAMGGPKKPAEGDVRLVQTGGDPTMPQGFQLPQQMEKLRDLPFPSGVNLQFIIRELAKDLDLNVLFDTGSQQLATRTVRIELKNVTAARALDYIFLQENLFFQKVGPRTILVADNARRALLQQLVLRTFFLANASPKDIKAVIQTAIPAQQGRTQTIVLEDAATNSVTVRDTAENVALIGKLIQSLDKDRAEVVMDVAIYEVNKNDLLQFGNQIGTAGDNATLLNLGGIGLPFARTGTTGNITNGMRFPNIGSASLAIGLPVSTIAALQTKTNTKLLASTQIHAFNNEDSSARIGQRVPVRTASFAPIQSTGGQNPNNNFVGDVINYEQVGLTLKFKPIVFPNQDVQVAMEIESKDVAGGTFDNPVFTERTIKGTARVQNNKTLLLASVAQGVESRGRSGLPLVGLIPILGRLFTAPTKENRQVDIVIAVTPRVIRAPAIVPDDEVERPTGSVATPTGGSLEAMLIQEERDEYLASVRRLPKNSDVQLADQAVTDAPNYVRSALPEPAGEKASTAVAVDTPRTEATPSSEVPALRRIDTNPAELNLRQTANTFAPTTETKAVTETEPSKSAMGERDARITFGADLPSLEMGKIYRIPVLIEAAGSFNSAVLGLSFDEQRIAVRSVIFGEVFGPRSATPAAPFLNQNGKLYVSLRGDSGELFRSSGTLAIIEIEALQDGPALMSFERDVMNVIAADGRSLSIIK